MTFDLLAVVVPLLLVDVLNPVLLAATIYAVGTTRPYANSLSLLCGHTTAYFIAGIAITLGLDRIMAYLANPTALDFALQVVLGAALVLAGRRSRGGRASESKAPPAALAPGGAFVFGVVINFVGVPFALPYFAVLDQFLKAELPWQPTLALLVAYNLAYVLPFLLVPATLAILGDRSRVTFRRISDWVNRAADWVMPKVLVIIGAVLIADATSYFVRGHGFI